MACFIINPFRFASNPTAISQTASAEDTANLTTYTFSSLSLGAAVSDRLMIATIHGRALDARTISSVTIAGVSAAVVSDGSTSAFAEGSGSGDNTQVAMYIAAVPTGTTGDVVVTFSGGLLRAACTLHRLVNASGATADEVGTHINADPLTATINIPNNGSALGAASTGGNRTTVWTNLTETTDAVVESNLTYSSANDDFVTGGSTALTADFSGILDPCAVFASWAPA